MSIVERIKLGGFAGCGVLLLSCGGLIGDKTRLLSGENESESGEDLVSLPDATCSMEWDVIYEGPRGALNPRNLVRVEDTLVVDFLELQPASQWVRLQPLNGTEGQNVVVDQFITQMWTDGDRAILWGGGQLARLSQIDGTVETLLNLDTAVRGEMLGPALLRTDALFWTEPDSDVALALWKHDRETGERTWIATLDRSEFLQPELSWAGDSVLVASQDGSGTVFSLSGESPRDLQIQVDGVRVGMGMQGVYYSHRFNGSEQGGRANRIELRLAPIDGSEPVRLWSGQYGEFVTGLWELAGGWLGVGHFFQRNGDVNGVVVAFDDLGRQRLVACNPGPERFVLRPIVWNDRLFAVGIDGETWRILSTSVHGIGTF